MKSLPNGLSWRAVVSFLVSLLLCGFLISASILSKANIEKLQLEQLILEVSVRINEVISGMLYKTQALSAIVIQGGGDVEDFNAIAPAIVADDSSIMYVLLAPDGVVSKVYPLQGNETTVGLDLFGEVGGSKEAMNAKELEHLVLAGPFVLAQTGNYVLAGRMPVYLDTPTERHHFWGLVSVTLKFPQVMENVGLEIFKSQGFVYELWRMNPDTGDKQVIAHSTGNLKSRPGFVERNIHILNADWFLRVWTVHSWYSYPENWILIAAGFFISFLVFFVMQNNFELWRMKIFFEKMSKIDPVTGIFNRRYMDETLKHIISSLSRSNCSLSLLMIDVDLFKNYNDTYGHTKGDACLKAVAEVIGGHLLRVDDFVVRYGGEEFVVVLPNTSERGARMVAHRMLEAMRERKIMHESSYVANHVTISIGATTGIVQHTLTGDDFIKRADNAMYMSKQNGRDQYTYLDLERPTHTMLF